MRLLPALTASVVLLTACDTSSGSDSTPITSDVAPATTPTAVADSSGADQSNAAAPAALQFSAPLVGGGELDASSLAGKPTVFWFWAPT